jgi:hypothetical protein
MIPTQMIFTLSEKRAEVQWFQLSGHRTLKEGHSLCIMRTASFFDEYE